MKHDELVAAGLPRPISYRSKVEHLDEDFSRVSMLQATKRLRDIDPKELTPHQRQHPTIVPSSSLFVLPKRQPRWLREPMRPRATQESIRNTLCLELQMPRTTLVGTTATL